MASSDEKDEGQEDGTGSENCPEDSEVVLDLSGRRLKRLERAPINQTFATALVLDNNNLQNLSNLDSYGELERLSIATNQVVRMYWFARMYSLRILNLPNNNIVQIEGLRELHHLIHLNLSGNNIKGIEGLCHSQKLEHLNLSGNFITQITDLSMLRNLKELFLHRNRIGSLHRGSKYLPSTLFILTLSDNSIADLNDLCNLSHLTTLEQFTILNNPCLEPVQQLDESGETIGPPLDFDNRPYVINWCLNLKVLDGYKVTPKESLKAEWLYSQGKGRGFQVGEHSALIQYLSGVCLAGGGWGGADLPDDDDKLGKILQLAKQHQHELRHSSVNGHDNSDSSSGHGSRGSSHHDSPASLRRSTSRSASLRRNTAPPRPNAKIGHEGHERSNSHTAGCVSSAVKKQRDINSHSYHVELSSTLYGGDLRTPDTPGLMTQSMDPALLAQLSSEAQASSSKQNLMSQSLGPEHMSVSLRTEHMLTSYSVSGLLEENESPSELQQVDLMSQSLGPEQLKMSLGGGDLPPRPTRLFSEESNSLCEELTEGSALEGSSQFVPAPESIMSPDFQTSVSQHSKSTSSKYSARPSRPPPSVPRASSGQTTKITGTGTPRASSSQRPKTAPTKTPESSRGSPRMQHRAQSSATPPPAGSSSPRLRQSPKPAPRSTKTPIIPPPRKKSPPTPKAPSEGESDNTDSEMSVSKLQTIKSIAAERKGRERRSASSRQEASMHSYQSDKYRSSPQNLRNHSRGRKSSNSSGGSLESRGSSRGQSKSRGDYCMSELQAAVTLQRHWRGFCARNKNPKVARIREDIRHSRAEQHIRYLSDKLRVAEAGLEKERRLRHLQLDAIRTLWREIQKLQASRGKDGVITPSTPMTPLTPLTPLESKKVNTTNKNNKLYSEESVKELTQFCTSLQSQVTDLQDSLSMVTQVMNAFCQLPGSQSLLSQSSGSAKDGPKNPPPLSQSVTSFTNSIVALTSSIKYDGGPSEQKTKDIPPELVASVTSIASTDMSSTGQDVSTLSIDDSTHQADLSDSSSHSSAPQPRPPVVAAQGPTRPSSLPVARPHTPRAAS